jgi:hypothetical protein
MKIEDLIQILNNRLREFKLSRDYARMSGDLERMNTAEEEIIVLEDTIYKLELLADAGQSDNLKNTTLTDVIKDGSVAVLSKYDITPYATDPLHEEKIKRILSKMPVLDTLEKIDDYIRSKTLSSPITGKMVKQAAEAYDVDVRLMVAIMEQDSSLGTAGLAVRTRNPGNVGNDDAGNIRIYESWQAGVTAVAEWLSRHRMETKMSREKSFGESPDSTPSYPKEGSFVTKPAYVSSTVEEFPAGATTTPTTTTTSTTTTSTTTTSTTTPVTGSGGGSASTSTPSTSGAGSTSSTTPSTSTSTTTPSTSTSTPTISSTSTTTTATSTPTPTTSGAGSTSTTSPSTSSSSNTSNTTPSNTSTTTTSVSSSSEPEEEDPVEDTLSTPITQSTATTTAN